MIVFLKVSIMASAAVKNFLGDVSVENLKTLKKPELLELAAVLEMEEIKATLRKPVIARRIAERYVEDDEFSEEDLDQFPEPSKVTHMSETEEKIQLMQLELQREREERERMREEREHMREEREHMREEKERQIELKKMEMEEKKMEMEREEKVKRMEMEENERQRRFELEKLERGLGNKDKHIDDRFVASREVRLVPPFDETEVDKYFQHFEKVAGSLKWPIDQWTLMLQSVIKGKAQIAYSSMSVQDSSDYDKVKAQILKAYELVPEAYRQKFRSLRKADGQTHVEFAHDKEVYFERWCTSMTVDGDFNNLKELVLVEEFKRCVRDDIKSFLDEKEAGTLQQAAKLADEYALTHKKFGSQDRSHNFRRFQNKPGSTAVDTKAKVPDNKGSDSSSNKKDKSTVSVCNYCKKPGHVLSECYSLKNRKEKESQAKGNGLVKSFAETPVVDLDPSGSCCPSVAKDAILSETLMEEFLPFVSEGCVSRNESSAPTPIRILRDTGASQSLLLATSLPFCDETATGDYVLCQGIEGRTVSVPLHSVFLNSDFFTGQVKVGLMSSLPMKGVSMLLGNDLAGGKVVPSVCLSAQPCIDDDDSVDTDIFTSCAVTRAMVKKAKEEEDSVQSSTLSRHDSKTFHDSYGDPEKDLGFNHLSDTFIGTLFGQDLGGSQNSSTLESDVSGDFSLSRKQLIKAQGDDPEISELKEKALSDDDIAKVPVGYYLKDGVLMRKFRPSDVAADEEWAVVNQVVVPKVYRNDILSMAHSLPLGGHLGINKTTNKILRQFFWPGLRKDVSNFCKSCHTCQVVGKHKLDPPVAPLQPIPAFGEPFSRVIIDCVGPLPRTKAGNQYLLTIMCSATRFPEAIPLRNIKASTVSKALLKFFSLFGLPKDVYRELLTLFERTGVRRQGVG